MSTRRARIKAVASLPVRRKNTEGTEKKRTPANDSPKNSKNITSIKDSSLESNITISATETSTSKGNVDTITTITSSIKSPVSAASKISPFIAEKVPVITPTSLYKNVLSSALSPQAKSSPVRIYEKKSTPGITQSNIVSKPINKNESDSDTDAVITSKQTEADTHPTQSAIPEATVSKPTENNLEDRLGIEKTETQIIKVSTEEAVLDGIIPLQATPKVPKPLDLLRNEIISENAEVLFDPIVPLPSPSKVRPKLRPVPRLAPLRRNSVQGSASESEDETRRALLGNSGTPLPPRQRHDSYTSLSTQSTIPNREVNRVRNDSLCSVVSQTTQPTVPPSPLKEKHLMSKSKRLESSRRMSALRRRQRVRESGPKDGITMYDLIFLNPTSNPIVHDKDEAMAKEKNESQTEDDCMTDDNVDDPPEPKTEEAVPVPQIKLGANGEIILDEKSLVIDQTEGPRKLRSTILHEGEWTGRGGKYTRTKRTAEWSDAETVRFYRALATVGTDFTVMGALFPDRNRRDLKIKFKKEERINSMQVDKALRSQIQWDMSQLQEDFKKERQADVDSANHQRVLLMEQRQKEREQLRAARGLKIARGAKSIDIIRSCSKRNNVVANPSADEFLEELLESSKRDSKNRRNSLSSMSVKVVSKPALPSPIDESLATVTPTSRNSKPHNTPHSNSSSEMATLTKVPVSFQSKSVASVPSNIENGSLVVLTVNDPNSATKKMLQAYISDGTGKLTPVALPPSVLNSVVGYINKGTPSSTPKSVISNHSSPQLASNSRSPPRMSPNMGGVIKVNPSPSKRRRLDSYNITEL